MKLHIKPTMLPNSSQITFNQTEPSRGKARKTNNNQKTIREKNPERCHVKAKISSDPFVDVRTSDGGSAPRGFTTKIRPKDSN